MRHASLTYLCSMIVLTIGLCGSSFAQTTRAQRQQRAEFRNQAGSIEGAIWNFELKPKQGARKDAKTIRGRYRVSDLKLYQAETVGAEMTKEVGVSKPNTETKATIVEFESLRGMTGPKQPSEPLKGKALLKLIKFGELEGEFIDSEGYRWDMRVKRIQE